MKPLPHLENFTWMACTGALIWPYATYQVRVLVLVLQCNLQQHISKVSERGSFWLLAFMICLVQFISKLFVSPKANLGSFNWRSQELNLSLCSLCACKICAHPLNLGTSSLHHHFYFQMFFKLNTKIILSSLELWTERDQIQTTRNLDELLQRFTEWKYIHLNLRPHDVAFLLM